MEIPALDLAIAKNLLLAALLSGLIGFGRTLRHKPAGLRTHLLVGLGSALIMMISIKMVELFPGASVDPSRIAANVVVGLGFLGAGTIMRSGSSVHGLTTAASVWATGAVGLAVGCGYYSAALQTAAAVLVVLEILDRFERGMVRRLGRIGRRDKGR